MASAIFYFLNGLVLIAFVASGVFWSVRLFRSLNAIGTGPLVPLEQQNYPAWNLSAFLVMFGGQIVAIVSLMYGFRALGWIDAPPPGAEGGSISLGMLISNSLGGLIAMAGTVAYLSQQSRPSEFGFAGKGADVLLGLKAAVWFLPPVMLISAAATMLIEYEHPVLEKLAESAGPMTFVALFIGTAFVAPVVEEFLFRVLLQGGLQKLFDGPIEESPDEDLSDSQSMQAAEPGTDLADAYKPPATLLPTSPVSLHNLFVSQPGRFWMPRAFLPIVLTSIAFAAMHIGQGAAFIPLFFLSLGLGYLYQRTGRITASLIVHLVLNALTMCVEISRIAADIPSP